VPLKKGSDVDLGKPLKNLIASLYSTADKPADFSTAIAEFQRLRTTAVSKQFEKSHSALEALMK
jgi:programmed cell death 6-interacting protein